MKNAINPRLAGIVIVAIVAAIGLAIWLATSNPVSQPEVVGGGHPMPTRD